MTGLLIVNEFLNTKKFIELADLFMDAAKKLGINLIKKTNADFIVDLTSGDVLCKDFNSGSLDATNIDFIVFYDKDITLAKALEEQGFSVFNYYDAIEACDSKAKTALYVSEYNATVKEVGQEEWFIRMPKTFKVPFTYENIGINSSSESNEEIVKFLDLIADDVQYPLVFKECQSSFGMGVHLAKEESELIELIKEFGNKECIIQEFIGKDISYGCDVRLQMVSEECVAAMKRSNDHDFRANITNGGTMSAYKPSEKDLTMAISVMRAIGLDFAGIDLMFDKDGEPVFCEANSNAHFKNLYDLTGVNTAEHILEYIVHEIEG